MQKPKGAKTASNRLTWRGSNKTSNSDKNFSKDQSNWLKQRDHFTMFLSIVLWDILSILWAGYLSNCSISLFLSFLYSSVCSDTHTWNLMGLDMSFKWLRNYGLRPSLRKTIRSNLKAKVIDISVNTHSYIYQHHG